VLSPEANDPKGYIRIIDESGEDYLYSAKGFEIISCRRESSASFELL
jgi:hypothetical protein